MFGLLTCVAVAVGVWFAVDLGKHKHDYGGWVTDNDYHWRECQNDDCNEKLIEKSAHSDADNDGKCDICLIEHNHSFSEDITGPTCTKKGFTEHTCTCGYHYKDEETAELGHDFGEDNHCTRCGYFKHEHEYEETVIEPTCTEGGYTRGDCIYCDAGYFSAHTDPLGHDFVDGQCTRCNEWKPTEGLEYALSSDGNSYICSGAGSAVGSQIVIAPEYDGKKVTAIGDKAFQGTDAVRVIIPNTVTSIGREAFSNARNMESVNIPEGVTSIGRQAFEYCLALTEITIPDSVASVGLKAFFHCENLISVTVGGAVGDDMFYYCEKIESVTIREGVTSIGSYAFSKCTNLETLTIPTSVKSFGEMAFYQGDAAKVYITDLAKWCSISFGEASNPLGYELYVNGQYSKNLIIPDGITSISNRAFDGYLGMSSVTIPSSVTTIGEYAFQACFELDEVVIPSSVTVIEKGAFAYCIKLTDITLPDSVTVISSELFRRSGLVSIKIPEKVTAIEDYAFNWCESLKSVVIPDSVISIGNYAFSGIPNFTSSLESVTFGKGLASIGDYAFYRCDKLTEIELPENLKSIGDYAFSDCDGLTSVVIPDKVTNLGRYAFYSCGWLVSITIPKSVTKIDGLFNSSYSVTDIYYDGTKKQWEDISKYANMFYTGTYTVHCSNGDLVYESE